MEFQFRRTLAPALGALMLAGCNGAAPGPDQQAVRHYGDLAFTPCTLTAPYLTTTVEAQCATYDVAEDPAKPAGRKVALNIAWLPATNEGAATEDPVFFLAGGPGQSAVQVWPAIDGAFREVRKSRHIVLVDQRGTGKSNPLSCKDDEGRNAYGDAEDMSEASSVEFARACAASLQADPRFYTTTDAVRDLDSVRKALGAAKINLVGGSYGTRVAQQYAMHHPDSTRSVVIDGVVPNELVLGSEHARNLDAALALQFQRCQADATCKGRFGDDLRGQLRALMTRLAATPVSTEYRDPSTGELVTGEVTAGTVAGITRMYSYYPQGAALLPLVLNEAQQGRYGSLMSLAKLLETQVGDQFMHGMQLSVICAEDADLLKKDPADGDTVLGSALGDTLKAQCGAWPTGTRPADFHTAWTSDIPTLVASGEMDPVTPPRYGEQVLRTLSNGRHLVLKGQGHGTFAVGCMPKLLGRFLETADAKGLDATCLDSLDYVPPFTRFNGWEP
ncbi:alpha/beta hydrolase fold [Pseudoxanthomonas sp. CF385]|uniref:alpha/beta hydrolase n=1 Tax=Pseudoxanthomonas sp. CF385 TaxID=1881042 RepID=UPI00088CCF41|nr:alpha/beta hydrolase [Pseudoxanthomonas sp. CF385]SDQ22174.1 alpha/beta hydrolase fold [Pseudoxanthomonas sp. CF385]